MPTATAYACEAEFPEYVTVCRSLAGLIRGARRSAGLRGDQMIARYDAAAGAAASRDMEGELVAFLNKEVRQRPAAAERIRKRLEPQAEYGSGVKSRKVRTQLRAMDFEGMTPPKLLAALDACGYRIVLCIEPKPAA